MKLEFLDRLFVGDAPLTCLDIDVEHLVCIRVVAECLDVDIGCLVCMWVADMCFSDGVVEILMS